MLEVLSEVAVVVETVVGTEIVIEIEIDVAAAVEDQHGLIIHMVRGLGSLPPTCPQSMVHRLEQITGFLLKIYLLALVGRI